MYKKHNKNYSIELIILFTLFNFIFPINKLIVFSSSNLKIFNFIFLDSLFKLL